MKAASLLIAAALLAAAAPQEPSGYRTEDYRAAVPETVEGRGALSTEQAAEIWRKGAAIFIDTLPQPPRPPALPADTIWRPKPRYDIPGSIWLPDTGYGILPAVMEAYFAQALQAATHGNRSAHLVFYCLANCWMSWNAAKRARSWGYDHVDWFADGSDGWAEKALPLERREPVPRPLQ